MTGIIKCDAACFKAEVLEADSPVLVDFHAAWCAPCRTQGSILEDLAGKLGGAARVVKVDVDRSPELADLFAVRSIPTLLIFKGGRITDRFTGLTAAPKIAAALVARLA